MYEEHIVADRLHISNMMNDPFTSSTTDSSSKIVSATCAEFQLLLWCSTRPGIDSKKPSDRLNLSMTSPFLLPSCAPRGVQLSNTGLPLSASTCQSVWQEKSVVCVRDPLGYIPTKYNPHFGYKGKWVILSYYLSLFAPTSVWVIQAHLSPFVALLSSKIDLKWLMSVLVCPYSGSRSALCCFSHHVILRWHWVRCWLMIDFVPSQSEFYWLSSPGRADACGKKVDYRVCLLSFSSLSYLKNSCFL